LGLSPNQQRRAIIRCRAILAQPASASPSQLAACRTLSSLTR
jgi:hypothetical protein